MPSCSPLGGRPAGTEGPGSPAGARGGQFHAVGGRRRADLHGGRWAVGGEGPGPRGQDCGGASPDAPGRRSQWGGPHRWAVGGAGRPFS